MTDKQKPTPETDAEISRTAKIGVISGMEQAWQDMAYHAKELERQRDEAREKLEMARAALLLCIKRLRGAPYRYRRRS